MSLFALLVMLAWMIQSHLLLNWDVSWDLLVSERLLNGGTYSHDFFDLNPPLIFYVYAPAVFLSHALSIEVNLVFRLYLFILALFSIRLCHAFIRPLFIKEHTFFSHALLLSLVILFLLLPGLDFGEREHFLVIFTFPYLLMISYRLEDNPIHYWVAMSVGVFAFLGFALKPHFFIPCILVELFMMRYTKNKQHWARPEVFTLLILLTAYSLLVILHYPDYLSKVIPLSQAFYYAGFREPWQDLLYNPLMLFCGLAGLLYVLHRPPYPPLYSILCLSMVGFLAAYFLQQTSWGYHLLPAVSVAFFLICIFFGLFVKKHADQIPLISCTLALLFIIPSTYIEQRYAAGIRYKDGQQAIIHFLRTHATHKTVYFITASPREVFPAVTEAQTTYASRLLHLFWIPAVVKHHRSPKEESAFIQMVTDDLSEAKPNYLFIDIKTNKSFFLTYSFDYLPYLLQNKLFQQAFKPYHYLTTIESKKEPYPMYRFAVYRRATSSRIS